MVSALLSVESFLLGSSLEETLTALAAPPVSENAEPEPLSHAPKAQGAHGDDGDPQLTHRGYSASSVQPFSSNAIRLAGFSGSSCVSPAPSAVTSMLQLRLWAISC